MRLVGDDGADTCDAAVCTGPHPPEPLGRERAAVAVRAVLGQLCAAQRTCVTLAYFDGLLQVQIAQRLGRPSGTVKSWVRRALLAMRPALIAH